MAPQQIIVSALLLLITVTLIATPTAITLGAVFALSLLLGSLVAIQQDPPSTADSDAQIKELKNKVDGLLLAKGLGR